MTSELACNPEKRGKSDPVFDHDFWSVEEANLWPRKMGREFKEQRRKMRKEETVIVDLLHRAYRRSIPIRGYARSAQKAPLATITFIVTSTTPQRGHPIFLLSREKISSVIIEGYRTGKIWETPIHQVPSRTFVFPSTNLSLRRTLYLIVTFIRCAPLARGHPSSLIQITKLK